MSSHLSRYQLLQRAEALGTFATMTRNPTLAELPRTPRLTPRRNWSGTQSCLPLAREIPKDLDELIRVIRQASSKIYSVGSGHPFSALIPTDNTLLSLTCSSGLLSHDSATLQAKFGGGMPMSRMGAPLRETGQAPMDMTDVDYRTPADAIAIFTHGTGIGFSSYSAQARGLQLVTANGEALEYDAKHNVEVFDAAQVSLGVLGVVTQVRLQNRAAYRPHERQWIVWTEELLEDVRKNAYENQHWEVLVATHSDYALSIALNETDEPKTLPLDPAKEGGNELVGLIKGPDKYLSDLPETRRTLLNSLRHFARFNERVDDSYAVYANVRNVRLDKIEYSVPAEHGSACLRRILVLIRSKGLRTWFPIKYRYVRADDIPLSMFEDRSSCSIPMHRYYSMNHHNFFATVEPTLWKYAGRPHWGRPHGLSTHQLQGLYPCWKAFAEMRQALDPRGWFLNAHFSSILGVI